MAPIVASTEIKRRPNEVFAYVTDPKRLPEWQRTSWARNRPTHRHASAPKLA